MATKSERLLTPGAAAIVKAMRLRFGLSQKQVMSLGMHSLRWLLEEAPSPRMQLDELLARMMEIENGRKSHLSRRAPAEERPASR